MTRPRRRLASTAIGLMLVVGAALSSTAVHAAPRGVVSYGSGKRPIGTQLVQLPDGRLLVGGVMRLGRDEPPVIVRFSGRGRLDRGFGRRGLATRVLRNGFFTSPTTLSVARDGTFLVAAEVSLTMSTTGVAAAFFSPRGTPRGDVSWAAQTPDFTGELERYEMPSIVLQPAGPPLLLVNSLGGYFSKNAHGCSFALDSAYGRAGSDSCLPWNRDLTEARFAAGVPDPRGGAIVAIGGWDLRGPKAAEKHGFFGIARVDAAGMVDASFGTRSPGDAPDFGTQGGDLTIPQGARTVAPRPGGGWVVAGPAPGGWGLAGFTATGAVDPAFGLGGKALIDPDPRPDPVQLDSLTPLRDGRLLAVGHNFAGNGVPKGYAAIVRGDGSLDGSFGRGGKVVITPRALGTDEIYSLTGAAEQGSGKIVLLGTGWSERRETTIGLLFRLKRNGALDRTFGG